MAQDLSYVTKISTDETSAQRGHNYITIFMDPEQKNVIYVTQWGLRSRLDPMVEVAKMLQKNYDGVIRWFMNNGLLEGVNSLFQAAKRKARGYRTEKNIIAMVYVLAGKLNFSLK